MLPPPKCLFTPKHISTNLSSPANRSDLSLLSTYPGSRLGLHSASLVIPTSFTHLSLPGSLHSCRMARPLLNTSFTTHDWEKPLLFAGGWLTLPALTTPVLAQPVRHRRNVCFSLARTAVHRPKRRTAVTAACQTQSASRNVEVSG